MAWKRAAKDSKATFKNYTLLASTMLLLILSIVVVAIRSEVEDARLTILRPGYGVHFDSVTTIVDGLDLLEYTASWSIALPSLKIDSLTTIDCQQLLLEMLSDDLNNNTFTTCMHINSLIDAHNLYTRQLVVASMIRLNAALDTIPAIANISSVFTRQRFTDQMKDSQQKQRRRRRQIDDEISSPTDVLDSLPWALDGKVFAGLVDLPGPSDLTNIEHRLLAVGKAMESVVASEVQFEHDMAKTILLVDARETAITNRGTAAAREMDNIYSSLSTLTASVSSIQQRQQRQMAVLTILLDLYISRILPTIYRQRLNLIAIDKFVMQWVVGIDQLAMGILPSTLITVDMIDGAIASARRIIATHYPTYILASTNAGYYYRTKGRVTYMKSSLYLTIAVKIPMYNEDGLYRVYRVVSYPIPILAGVTDTTTGGGHTHVLELPSHLAVSIRYSTQYIELTSAMISSCVSIVDSISTCGTYLPLARRANYRDITCAYAIYLDDAIAVRQYCQYGYTRTPVSGGAIQIKSDSSYVIQRSDVVAARNWTLNCPMSSTTPTSLISPCSLCRVVLPCGCSISAESFYVPPRISGCTLDTSNDRITYIYNRNICVVGDLVTPEDLAAVSAYSDKINAYFPPLLTPPPSLDKWWQQQQYQTIGEWLERGSDSYLLDYRKLASGLLNNNTIYQDDVAAALNKTNNYTDLVFRTTTDLGGAILDGLKSLTNVFGGIGSFLAAIFSVDVLSTLFFVITLALFVLYAGPSCYRIFSTIVKRSIRRHRNRRRQHMSSLRDVPAAIIAARTKPADLVGDSKDRRLFKEAVDVIRRRWILPNLNEESEEMELLSPSSMAHDEEEETILDATSSSVLPVKAAMAPTTILYDRSNIIQ